MKGDRFERLEQLRKEAAERLRLPLDHDKTQLLAALRLNHETLVEKLVAGNSVNPDQLLALSEAIDKLTPELPPQKITVEFVEGPIERCPACGWCRDDQVPSKKEPINITPKALPAPTVEAKPEEPTPPLRRHPGSIHNAVLPDGTPARLPPIDDGWRSHAGTVDSPYSNERLNFEAHHPWPMPPKGYCW